MNLLACPNRSCNGMLEFDYGNSYGCFYTCNVDLKQHILPTKRQLRATPERYIVEKVKGFEDVIRILFRNKSK